MTLKNAAFAAIPIYGFAKDHEHLLHKGYEISSYIVSNYYFLPTVFVGITIMILSFCYVYFKESVKKFYYEVLDVKNNNLLFGGKVELIV